MHRLVIIGNGFDIAHRIKSKYSDFRDYLLKSNAEFVKAIAKYIPDDLLWSDFEVALGNLDYEQLFDDNNHYLVPYSDEDWSESFHHDYQYEIGRALAFGQEIPNKLKSWIGSIITNVPRVFSPEVISHDNVYLCFNYTDTLEKSYQVDHKLIKYIHGCFRTGDELIIGHNDSHFKETDEFLASADADDFMHTVSDVRIEEAERIVRSYSKTTFKDTSDIVQREHTFFDSLVDVSEILVIGHSYSFVDLDYFAAIKSRVCDNCLWKLTCYNGEDLRRAYKLIDRLSISNTDITNVSNLYIN